MATIEQDASAQQKIERLRELFADAPEVGRSALERVLSELSSQAADTPPEPIVRAGRVGARLGKISELTMVVPLAPGGAKRLRAFLELLNGNLDGARKVGSVHDMRFVFIDDDTRLIFATTFDGDWDPYIDDFITNIPDYLDIMNSAWEGWPGIHHPDAKDYLAAHQVSAEGWYVGHADLTVADTDRLVRIGAAVDELLDKIGD